MTRMEDIHIQVLQESLRTLRSHSQPVRLVCEDKTLYCNLGLLVFFSPFIRHMVENIEQGQDTVIILQGLHSNTVRDIISLIDEGCVNVQGEYRDITKRINRDAKNMGLNINFEVRENQNAVSELFNDLSEVTLRNIKLEMELGDISDNATKEEIINELRLVDVNTLKESKIDKIDSLDEKSSSEETSSKVQYPCGICEMSYESMYRVLRCNTVHFLPEIKSKFSEKVKNNSCSVCDKTYSSRDNAARHIGEKHGITNKIRIQRGLQPIPKTKLKTNEKFIPKSDIHNTETYQNASSEKKITAIDKEVGERAIVEEKSKTEGKEDNFNIIRNVLLNKVTIKREKVDDTNCEDKEIQENANFSCKKCPFITKTNYNFMEHKRIDHQEQIFSCSECSFNGNSLYHLKRHIDAFHEDVKYSCNICEYKARRPDKLKFHKQSKHEGIFFPCEQCDYKASRKDHLKTHSIRIHALKS